MLDVPLLKFLIAALLCLGLYRVAVAFPLFVCDIKRIGSVIDSHVPRGHGTAHEALFYNAKQLACYCE